MMKGIRRMGVVVIVLLLIGFVILRLWQFGVSPTLPEITLGESLSAWIGTDSPTASAIVTKIAAEVRAHESFLIQTGSSIGFNVEYHCQGADCVWMSLMIEYGIEPLYAIDEKRSRHIQFVADFTTDRIQGQTALQVGEVIGRVEFSTIQPPVETALARALADVSVPSEPYRVVISARPRDRVWSVRFVPMDSDRAFEERNIAWE